VILHKVDIPHPWNWRQLGTVPFKSYLSSPRLTRCKALLLGTLMLLLQEMQCFSLSLEWGDSAQRWCCSSRKALRGIQYSLKEQTEFNILTKLLDPLVSNIKDSLTNFQFFSHLLVCRDFAQSWPSSSMKTLTVGQRSFQKLTQFTMLNTVQSRLIWNIHASLQDLQCFSLSLEWADSAQRWCCLSRKTVRSRQNSFKDQRNSQY
jgi:hypothetical protein